MTPLDTQMLRTQATGALLAQTMQTPLPQQRHMIIVWSWLAGGIVPQSSSWSVGGGREGFDFVHCLDLTSHGEHLETLREQILAHLRADAQTFVFLHRRHGYNSKHLRDFNQLKESVPQGQLRCFLFGDGADPLYLSQGPRGLLGTSGTFGAMAGHGATAQSLTSSIENEESRQIKKSHFDYVWQMYEHAFRAAFFELKEDLFRALAPLLGQATIDSGELYNWLRQPSQKRIFLRLLSFVGRIRQNSSLEKELRQFETEDHRRYIFADLGVDLAAIYGETTAQAYHEAKALISKQVLASGGPLAFVQLRKSFDDLLEQLPLPTYA